MAALKGPVKVFITERLACFEKPADIQQAVKRLFKVDVTPQQILAYNPTLVSGQNLGKTLREVFEAARARFLTDTANIPIANRGYRLRMLDKMADQMAERGNVAMVAQLLEQAAKEQGEAYTNRQKLEHSGAGGAPLTVVVKRYGDT